MFIQSQWTLHATGLKELLRCLVQMHGVWDTAHIVLCSLPLALQMCRKNNQSFSWFCKQPSGQLSERRRKFVRRRKTVAGESEIKASQYVLIRRTDPPLVKHTGNIQSPAKALQIITDSITYKQWLTWSALVPKTGVFRGNAPNLHH